MAVQVFDGFLGAQQCAELVLQAERSGFGSTAALYPEDYRNNDRLVLDAPELAAALFARFKEREPTTKALGFNARFRFCRYRAGQCFTVHRDGAFVTSGRRSRMTFQVYLNEGFAGGRTRFFEDKAGAKLLEQIAPQLGRAILFPHDDWHDGEAVPAGTKYVMRTDLMFAADEKPNQHTGYVWKVIHKDGIIYSSSRDGTVRTENQALQGPGGSVVSLAAASQGVLGATRSGVIFRADFANERCVPIAQVEAAVLDLVDADGFAAACADGTVRRANVKAQLHAGWAAAVAHFPRRNLLASVGHDGKLIVSRATDLKVIAEYKHARPLCAVAVSDWAVWVGDCEGELRELKFGCDTFTEAHTVRAHAGAITCIARQGELLATGGEDNRVRICHVAAPKRVLAETLHTDFVRSVAWTGEGTCVSGGYDAVLRHTVVP
jgi:hypothetical protein